MARVPIVMPTTQSLCLMFSSAHWLFLVSRESKTLHVTTNTIAFARLRHKKKLSDWNGNPRGVSWWSSMWLASWGYYQFQVLYVYFWGFFSFGSSIKVVTGAGDQAIGQSNRRRPFCRVSVWKRLTVSTLYDCFTHSHQEGTSQSWAGIHLGASICPFVSCLPAKLLIDFFGGGLSGSTTFSSGLSLTRLLTFFSVLTPSLSCRPCWKCLWFIWVLNAFHYTSVAATQK